MCCLFYSSAKSQIKDRGAYCVISFPYSPYGGFQGQEYRDQIRKAYLHDLACFHQQIIQKCIFFKLVSMRSRLKKKKKAVLAVFLNTSENFPGFFFIFSCCSSLRKLAQKLKEFFECPDLPPGLRQMFVPVFCLLDHSFCVK